MVKLSHWVGEISAENIPAFCSPAKIPRYDLDTPADRGARIGLSRGEPNTKDQI
jgi:hypothetical protein